MRFARERDKLPRYAQEVCRRWMNAPKRAAGKKAWKRSPAAWINTLPVRKAIGACAPACAGYSVQPSAKTAGSWPKPLGDRTPHGVQHLLGWAVWSADRARDDLLGFVKENLADAKASSSSTKPASSKRRQERGCGPAVQRNTAGRIENSQIGVFAAYVSPTCGAARTLIDHALHLPQAWTNDPARCRAASVPAEVGFATKPRLVRGLSELIARTVDAGLPCAWVVADSVYGSDGFSRLWLKERNQP